jgi:hypothetical protein
MAEMRQVFTDISTSSGYVKHLVMTSDIPGVFNFGGDLSLFVLLIRARDLQSLQMYGHRCIELIWWMETASERGVHTVVLVQGDALGGGLESVLPYHKVIFERSAQGGYPEVLFNLFPGMGAWNFTIRKAGFAVANAMIFSGHIYTADELHSHKLWIWSWMTGRGGGRSTTSRPLRPSTVARDLSCFGSTSRRGTDYLRIIEGNSGSLGGHRNEADRPRPSIYGAPCSGTGTQNRGFWRRRHRGDQEAGAFHRMGTAPHRSVDNFMNGVYQFCYTCTSNSNIGFTI